MCAAGVSKSAASTTDAASNQVGQLSNVVQCFSMSSNVFSFSLTLVSLMESMLDVTGFLPNMEQYQQLMEMGGKGRVFSFGGVCVCASDDKAWTSSPNTCVIHLLGVCLCLFTQIPHSAHSLFCFVLAGCVRSVWSAWANNEVFTVSPSGILQPKVSPCFAMLLLALCMP